MNGSADRGQTFTLEAVVAALLLVTSLAFAFQVTGVTSQSSSTADDHVSNQHAAIAGSALDAAAANGSLKRLVLYWNTTNKAFHGADAVGYYAEGGPPVPFWQTVEGMIDQRGLAVNVDVVYLVPDGGTERKRIVHQGSPSDEAGRASITTTVYDRDRLYEADGTQSDDTVADALDEDQGYMRDVSPDGPVFNVVRIEVIVWRV